MNGEDSFEAVQYIPVLKTDFIMKTTLDKELCSILIELAKQKMEDGAIVVVNIGHNKIKKFMRDQKKANEAIAKDLGLIK